MRTSRIRLTSAIMSIWGRTPATLAMSAATLQQISGGRYVLGLGTSTKALAEGFHDVPFQHPAARLRDVVTQVRALLAGEPARLRHATDARALRLSHLPEVEVPIWVAALGERTTRVAAEVGDGWIPALVARDRLGAWSGEIARMRAATVAQHRALTVAAGPIAVADEDPAIAQQIAAACAAWYLTAMGGVYARSVSGQGYAEQVDAIIAANPKPSPRHAVVTPDAQPVIDQLTASGTPGDVGDQLKLWEEAADIVTVLLPPGIPWATVEATLRAAAPVR